MVSDGILPSIFVDILNRENAWYHFAGFLLSGIWSSSTASTKLARLTGDWELFRMVGPDFGMVVDLLSRLLPLISRLFFSGEVD